MTDQVIDELSKELVKEILLTLAMEIERKAIENLRESGRMGKGISIRTSVDVSDVDNGEISVIADTPGSESGIDIAVFLEYGTGIYGPKHRYISAKHRTKSGKPGFMKFKKGPGGGRGAGGKIPGNIAFESGGYIFTQKSRGMKPTFFMTKAVEDVMARKSEIIREVLSNYGIGGNQ